MLMRLSLLYFAANFRMVAAARESQGPALHTHRMCPEPDSSAEVLVSIRRDRSCHPGRIAQRSRPLRARHEPLRLFRHLPRAALIPTRLFAVNPPGRAEPGLLPAPR